MSFQCTQHSIHYKVPIPGNEANIRKLTYLLGKWNSTSFQEQRCYCVSWIFMGLERAAQWNRYLGLYFFIKFFIDEIFKMFNWLLEGNIKLRFIFDFFIAVANLPFPPVIIIFFFSYIIFLDKNDLSYYNIPLLIWIKNS